MNALQDRIQVRFKRLAGNGDIPLPRYASKGAAGMDLRAAIQAAVTIQPGEIRLIPTGLSISVPSGYEAQIRPRSGLALNHGIGLVNSPGTIDADYRGEIGLIVVNWGEKSFEIRRGDRIAQIIIAKVYQAEILLVDDLDGTIRGRGGFGHTGIR
jgi:dUTP pyrophosphatase